VEEKIWSFERQSKMRKRKFYVCLVGQERKRCGGIRVEKWNGQYLGPRRGGLESLI